MKIFGYRVLTGIDVDDVAGPIEGGNEVTLARRVAARKAVSAALSNSIPGERQGHDEEDYGQEGRHERPTLSRAPVRTARHPLLSSLYQKIAFKMKPLHKDLQRPFPPTPAPFVLLFSLCRLSFSPFDFLIITFFYLILVPS
jgi:hypothetical protein